MSLRKAKGSANSGANMLIIADTSPLSYLILIQTIDVLPKLYGQIIIPPQVLSELQSTAGPAAVRAWASAPPKWLEVKAASAIDVGLRLDPGESAAIALAKELRADRLLIDEFKGRQIAIQMGIPIAGTLAVLRDAALGGLVDLKSSLEQLRKTTFRASPQLYAQILADFEKRKGVE